MPPKSSQKPAPKGNGNIMAFFGGGGGSSQSQAGPSPSHAKSQSTGSKPSTQSSGTKKGAAILLLSDSDDDDMTKHKKTVKPASNSKAPKPSSPMKPKSERVMAMDVDSDQEPLHAPTLKRKKPAALLSSDDDDEPSQERKQTPPKKKVAVAAASSSKPKPKPKPRTSVSTSAPAKSKVKSKKKAHMDDDYEDGDEDAETKGEASDDDEYANEDSINARDARKKKFPGKKPATKKTSTGGPKPTTTNGGQAKVKQEADQPDAEGKEQKKPKAKSFDWAAAKAAKLAGPVAHGSKAVPEPIDPMCLSGLAFVFTGELESFSRDEAIDLAKRFGGRVTGQPSSKTSYVVLGSDAGPSKLAAINKHRLKTLSEDAFLELIATRVVGEGGYDEKTKKKMEKEEEAIKAGARELEKRERKMEKEKAGDGGSSKVPDASTQLWTTRYAPQTLKEICGNKGQVEKLQTWLDSWSSSRKSNFKKPGKEGMNVFRAVMITGPPGIGKTTSAHLCAKLAGFTPIEVNASDSRSKKLVENGINMDNTSLDGWMGHGKTTNAAGVPVTDKTCLIMDEVDGMSAGDRGGVGALNALIKKTKIPIICIANDRNAQKLKPLIASTFALTFKKPDAAAVRSRMMTIAFKEKMKVPANVIDQLVNGAQSDIRQVLNMLSTWKFSSNSMDFDEGKNLAKLNEKFSIMTPFDITNKMLGPYMFSHTSRETLGNKMELYFHDHSFVPLFIQENYLKTQPAKIKNLDGPPQILRQLELMDNAASSISDGDLVDALIHGPEQHWGLMPLHAVCSTVRPASFLYGQGAGYGGPNAMSFPQFLGQNSKQGKLSRQLGDVQIRMRLKVSGDKSEIRQSYLPALFPYIVRPLMDIGASAVEDVIDRMDEYYLSREDWDTVIELGVDQNKDDLVLKKISAATKTTLTKKYNTSEHPIPFHKAQDLGKAPKKLGGGPAPDIEDAYDLADEAPEPASDDDSKKKSSDDVSNDKLIKAKKAKGKGKT